jgi:hypothetical protein
VFGGAQAGYDKQFGKWVLGVVADMSAFAAIAEVSDARAEVRF